MLSIQTMRPADSFTNICKDRVISSVHFFSPNGMGIFKGNHVRIHLDKMCFKDYKMTMTIDS